MGVPDHVFHVVLRHVGADHEVREPAHDEPECDEAGAGGDGVDHSFSRMVVVGGLSIQSSTQPAIHYKLCA